MERSHDSIFLVIETLKKSAHFILDHMTNQAPDISRIFFREIVRLHGVPSKIIYDRGSIFTRQF
jgi:hypothetical protein